jgi:hypothetical protein
VASPLVLQLGLAREDQAFATVRLTGSETDTTGDFNSNGRTVRAR